MAARHYSRIRTRLFLWFVALSLLVTLAMYLCLYAFVAPALKESAYERLQESASTQMRLVDQTINSMNSISVNLLYSSKVKDALQTMNVSGHMSYADQRELLDHVVAINGPMMPVSQIRLYALEGTMLACGTYNGQYNVDVRSMPWYDEVMAADGAKVMGVPTREPQIWSTGQYVALRRAAKVSSRTIAGVIEVFVNATTLFGGLSDSGDTQSLVINRSGDVMYPQGAAASAAVEAVLGSGGLRGIFEEETQLAAWQRSMESGWTLIVTQPRGDVLAPLYAVTQATVTIVAVLLVFTLVMAYLAARQFTRPIQTLAGRMRSYRFADEPQSANEPSGLDELDTLNRSFDKMGARLTESVNSVLLIRQQETQARMLALQSQMNPHFLHNALSNLEALIDLDKRETASAMISAMSRMLRYIASDAQALVPLEEELHHVQDYVDCMRLRFGENLLFELDDEGVPAGCSIPKLSLQPLVENAVKYGCIGQPPWQLTLSLTALPGNGWQAVMMDSGPGFTDETMAALHAQVEDIRKTGVLPRMEIDGMGLLNIAMRLNLYSGGNFIFRVENGLNGGGQVTIGVIGKDGA